MKKENAQSIRQYCSVGASLACGSHGHGHCAVLEYASPRSAVCCKLRKMVSVFNLNADVVAC